MEWYLKKEWVDPEPGVEAVNIHYTWTPPGQPPDWSRHHEVRAMPRGAILKTAVGLVTEDPRQAEAFLRSLRSQQGETPSNVRKKVLKLPQSIWDEAQRVWTSHYLLHHYFEVFQAGRRWTTDLFTEEIVSREVEYIDWEGAMHALCAYWSVYDWDAPQFSPMEEPRFIERFGPDNEFRSHKLYAYKDRPRFYREKWRMINEIPKPWRWRGRVWGPRGAPIVQRWHRANLALPPGQAWEDWTGDDRYTLEPDGSGTVAPAGSSR